jgi:hypothetical protein
LDRVGLHNFCELDLDDGTLAAKAAKIQAPPARDKKLRRAEARRSKTGSPGRIRTSDQPVNSRLLYR